MNGFMNNLIRHAMHDREHYTTQPLEQAAAEASAAPHCEFLRLPPPGQSAQSPVSHADSSTCWSCPARKTISNPRCAHSRCVVRDGPRACDLWTGQIWFVTFENTLSRHLRVSLQRLTSPRPFERSFAE